MRVGLKEGLTKAQGIKLRDLSPQVRAWAEEISIVPDTIQHDDLHDDRHRQALRELHERLIRLQFFMRPG